MFNQTLDRVTFPPTLHTLTFGNQFNQPLGEITLPNSLYMLTFGDLFSHSLCYLVLPLPLHLTIRKRARHMSLKLLLPGLKIQYI